MRIEVGLDLDAGIDEARLLFVAPGRRGIVGRACQQRRLRHAADIGDRLRKCRANVADIAAKRDQNASHSMEGMYHESGDEDRVGHRFSSIAAATRNACTVSATSWVRMIRAPPLAAITCAAIEPPRR